MVDYFDAMYGWYMLNNLVRKFTLNDHCVKIVEDDPVLLVLLKK